VLAYFTAFSPALLHPCHCTSLAAKIALAAVTPLGEVGVGLRLEY
jgi:7,8-dihydropterin-6-yl-methyl-4-(beta-D-ribofuranosyl)aminobenzene 5'-phosphate synthase